MTENVRISFGIVARMRIPELDLLVDELLVIEGPAQREIIVGVETPGTTTPVETPDERGVRWIALPPHCGVGYNRNRVLDAARGDVLVGVDDDCMPRAEWLDALLGAVEHERADAAVGCIEIPPSGYIGDCISALGFPAGGAAGYETMFHVGADGTTDNLAAGNCAMRTDVIRQVGGYDESLTYGGEDTELAYRLKEYGKRTMYVPEAILVHPARRSLTGFARWFFVRGRAKCQFARRVPISGYVSQRLGSYGKILRANLFDAKIFLIVPLLGASLVCQQAGFIAESLRPTPGGVQTGEPTGSTL